MLIPSILSKNRTWAGRNHILQSTSAPQINPKALKGLKWSQAENAPGYGQKQRTVPTKESSPSLDPQHSHKLRSNKYEVTLNKIKFKIKLKNHQTPRARTSQNNKQ